MTCVFNAFQMQNIIVNHPFRISAHHENAPNPYVSLVKRVQNGKFIKKGYVDWYQSWPKQTYP